MARPRLELQTLLEGITDHVYFQAPGADKMQYPCIKYERDGSDSKYADNSKYVHHKRYQVTVIDRNPDSVLSDSVEELEFSAFERFFPQDGLNHWVFTLFF